MSLYVQVPIQQIADGLTAIGWSSAGGGGDATLSYSATVPATPVNGTLWYDTTATLLKLYTGGTWTTINVSAETIATIQGYVTSAQSAATTADQKLTEFKAIQVTATTLSAGASATASYNSGTGVITLGIPTGATGSQGIQGIQGVAGTNGTNGTNGVGVPTGGTTGQVLSKVDATNYNTTWIDPPEGGGTGGYTESSTAPISPVVGDEWFDLTDGTLYKRVSDGVDALWMSVNSISGVVPQSVILQIAKYTTGAKSTGTNIMPSTNIIQQISNGTQFMALNFTAKEATSLLKIDINFPMYATNSQTTLSASVFKESSTNALGTTWFANPNGSNPNICCFTVYTQAIDTLQHTYSLRAGSLSPQTVTFNGEYGGGTLSASITITEIKQ